jgi:hypothetical protein
VGSPVHRARPGIPSLPSLFILFFYAGIWEYVIEYFQGAVNNNNRKLYRQKKKEKSEKEQPAAIEKEKHKSEAIE